MSSRRAITRVVVVGAGPAGSSAAYHLARRGCAVTLIDRSEFPRDKTCGDWLTQGALTELDRLGLDFATLRPHGAVVRSNVVVAPNGRGNVYAHADSSPSLCIPRCVFDDLLYRRAIAAGCTPQTRSIRDLARESTEGLAGYDAVIDARGVYAGQANTVALRTYLSVPNAAVDRAVTSRVHLFTDGENRMGYGWVFPVGGDGAATTYNLGVGAWKDAGFASVTNIRAYLDYFATHNPLVARLYAAATEVDRPRGYHLALADGPQRVASGRIFRVGDAANLTDPVTGEGIASAIDSGRVVAEILSASPGVAEAASRWQASYERDFLPRFRSARRIRELLSGTRRKNAAVWLLDRFPGLAGRFHTSLEGVASYEHVVPRWARRLVGPVAKLCVVLDGRPHREPSFAA